MAHRHPWHRVARRAALLSSVAVSLVTAAAADSAAAVGPTRVCVTEHTRFYADPLDVVRRRLDLYEQLGVDTLRLHSDLPAGALTEELRTRRFHLKIILYVLGLPPEYWQQHPEAAMVDERGVADWHLGPWSADLESQVAASGRAQLERLQRAGLLEHVDEIVADLGPAGEAIYPANWTLARDGEEAYWCYSAAAQADFRRAMQAKYGPVAAANAAWGLAPELAFAAWERVAIPVPGTTWARGAFWDDLLTWYRDAKRRLISVQIANTRRLLREFCGDRARVVVYLPGWAYTAEDWRQAVATAAGPASIRLMTDNDWLMAQALEQGCVLQYTGAENAAEVRRIVTKLKAMGSDAYRSLWAENAGIESCGRDPQWLVRVITAFGLRGIDLTWSNWLFEDDHMTPSRTFRDFDQACQAMRRFYATGARPDFAEPVPAAPIAVAPGRFDLTCAADTRLLDLFPDSLHGWDAELGVFRGPQQQRSLFRFALAGLPAGWSIRRAVLRLHGFQVYDGEAPTTLQAWSLTAPWSERAASWQERDLEQPWQNPGGDVGGVAEGRPWATASAGRLGADDVVELDLTALVRAWAAGTCPNYGVLIRVAEEALAQKSLASREAVRPECRPVLQLWLDP